MRLKFIKTCSACPEQYDVYDEETEKQIAYIRVRHGVCRCDVPNGSGETIYRQYIEGDGCFTDTERPHYMRTIINAIMEYYNTHEIGDSTEESNDINDTIESKQEELGYCPKCKKHINPNYRFCPHCGYMREEKRCFRCKKKYIENARMDITNSVLVDKTSSNGLPQYLTGIKILCTNGEGEELGICDDCARSLVDWIIRKGEEKSTWK